MSERKKERKDTETGNIDRYTEDVQDGNPDTEKPLEIRSYKITMTDFQENQNNYYFVSWTRVQPTSLKKKEITHPTGQGKNSPPSEGWQAKPDGVVKRSALMRTTNINPYCIILYFDHAQKNCTRGEYCMVHFLKNHPALTGTPPGRGMKPRAIHLVTLSTFV